MSKNEPLWNHIRTINSDSMTLSFDEAEQLLGFPVDHSFLRFKKELTGYGWEVGKISLKHRFIQFRRLPLQDSLPLN
ncbi:hypothetical protein [Faecalibaculum rodentium]|uniref:hypothetical protein n=1 Tax=Faecalibaculum rodentium TaxID=1702221 RepID=UPI0023F4677F|nr:hypothetical protein [Faecalibaculum rodentium]